MKNCAMTLEYCQEIGGSNALFLDIANVLKNKYDYKVTFYVFQLSQIVKERLEAAGHKVYDLLKIDPFSIKGRFDLVWGAHWPVLGTLLTCGDVEFKNLVLHSMSPFVDFERIFMFTDIADIILFNSEENFESHQKDLGKCKNLKIFPNSLPDDFFEGAELGGDCKYDFSYVGNHYTPELVVAFERLRDAGYRVRMTGRHFGQSVVNEKYIDETKVVVTIGHTVLKSAARKRHVYIYDRFGGYGYLRKSNFHEYARRNFSGRYGEFKSPSKILEELINFNINKSELDKLHKLVRESFSLENNIKSIVKNLDARKNYMKIDRDCNRNFFILSYSYYAQRAGLKRVLSHSWFSPVLSDNHMLRHMIFEEAEDAQWKLLLVNFPERSKVSPDFKSFQIELFLLHEQEQNEVDDVIAQFQDGRVFYAMPKLSSPQIQVRYKDDSRAGKCRYVLLVPIGADDRSFEIFAKGKRFQGGQKRIGIMHIKSIE